MRRPSYPVVRLVRLLTFLFLAVALLPVALPVAADGRPQPIPGFHCTFEGAVPAPGSSQARVRAVSIAFRCFDGEGRLILPTNRLFAAEFFVDGIARDFQRAGEFDTEILFVEFPNGLPAGKHTARVVVEGKASFSWSFRVTQGGASHQRSDAGTQAGIAKTATGTTERQPFTCATRPFDGLIAACAPAAGRLTPSGF